MPNFHTPDPTQCHFLYRGSEVMRVMMYGVFVVWAACVRPVVTKEMEGRKKRR